MGTDFLRNKRARHTKAWRQGVTQMEGDWIAGAPRIKRVFRAKPEENTALAVNQEVVLRLVADNQVVASVGVQKVASLIKPSLALVERLKQCHGIGVATVQKTEPTAARLDLVVED